jgi:hypothetical protein
MPTYVIYYTQGNTPGPFDVYLSGSSGLTIYASNIPQYELVNGYLVTFPDGIPSSSINVFDVSFGCFTDQNVPFPSVTPSITPSITVSPSVTPSITVSPSKTPSVTVTPSVTPSVTPPPSITRTPSVTPSISVSPGASPSPTPTPSITRTPSLSSPPSYAVFGITLGSSTAYLACYDYASTGGFMGGAVYVIDPPGLVTGATVYQQGLLGYTPVIGNDLWYAIGSYTIIGVTSVFKINNSGVITESQIVNCSF